MIVGGGIVYLVGCSVLMFVVFCVVLGGVLFVDLWVVLLVGFWLLFGVVVVILLVVVGWCVVCEVDEVGMEGGVVDWWSWLCVWMMCCGCCFVEVMCV